MWGVSLSLFALIVSLESRVTVCGGIGDGNVSRDDFPDGFVFGAASSAYQTEGAANEDGRTPSIWDTFAKAGHMKEDTRDIACDGYHKYKFRILVRRNLRLNHGPLKGKETITMTRRTPCIRGACWGPTFTIIRSKNSPYSTLEDWSRAEYLQAFIGSSVDTIRNGTNVKGYFAWSFLDSFELLDGYESRFGLYYVDFDDPELKRTPKLSAHWYSHFLKRKSITLDGIVQSPSHMYF